MQWISMSDKAIALSIGEFIRHHRLEQNKSQQVVSNDAGISRSTLSLLERGESVTLATLIQVLRVLDLLYIMNVFNIEKQVSPIELAKLDRQKRLKAGRSGNKNTSEIGW